MKKIELTRGLYALIDDEDFEYLSKWKWHASKTKPERTFYAVRSLPRTKDAPRKTVFMHREIVKPKKGMVVDHVNGNGLDNRKKNLRELTQSLNTLNQTRLRKTNKSGFVGIYWSKQKNKWHALISFRRGMKHVGFFDNLETAAKRLKAAKAVFFET